MRLSTRALCVRHRTGFALKDVDFAVAAGELVALIGPNGAGKTTLLRTLAGLQDPSSGAVCLDDKPIGQIDRRERARRIAFMPASGDAEWPMTVQRIVELGRIAHGSAFIARSNQADEIAVTRAMRATGVDAFARRRIDTLSGGERARVMLARALAVGADILLCDEPTARLDPYHQLRVMEVLRDASRAGVCVVVVVHDLTLASRYCDRLVLLANGQIAAAGAPATVLSEQMLAAVYGVSVARVTRDGETFVVPTGRLVSGHGD